MLFKQSQRNVESLYPDVGAYDMLYSEIKQMCRTAWNEKINYLCIDLTKSINEVNIVVPMKPRNTYNECVCESEAFCIFKCFQLKSEKI